MLLIATACGIFFGFPNDIASLPPLVLLWPLGLAMLGNRSASASVAFRHGWLASMAGAIPCLYWLALPVHDVGGLPLPLAGVCAIFIATCLAVQGGFFSLLARLASQKLKGGKLAGFWPSLFFALYLGLSWALLEQFLAWLFGFPWLAIAGAMAAWPVLVQFADSLGAYAMSGLWVTATLLVWPVFAGSEQVIVGKRLIMALPGRSGPAFSPATLLGLAIMAGLLAYGTIRLDDGQAAYLRDARRDPAERVTAILVEGNVDQNQKWEPAFQQANVDLYIGLSRSGLAALADPQSRERQLPERPDLVIWPETAMPFFYETRPELARQIRDYARESAVPLLFGSPGTDPASKSGLGRAGIYNRAFLLDGSGVRLGHYDKEHLVPFGEYLPEWLNWKFLEALLQGVGVYDQGTAIAPLELPLSRGKISMGMLVCYEGIFPWLARQRVADGADLLVDISNDGWFRDTPAARQHLYQTTLRALEQNRWLLRGTNTGISCAIDPRGRIVQSGGQFQTGWHVMNVWPEKRTSLFYRLFPWLWPFFGILWLVMSAFLMYAWDSTSNNRLENAPPE